MPILSNHDWTPEDYIWLHRMREAVEGQSLPAPLIEQEDKRERVIQCRNYALEKQNAALWAHVGGLTEEARWYEQRADTWRSRWAIAFGIVLLDIASRIIQWVI